MEAFHKLKVNSPYEILEIEDIKISNKPNEHGTLYLKVLVDENVNFKYAIEASTDDKICIYEETENKEKTIIFNGTIQNIRTSNENRLYYMEIEAVTSSFSSDIEEKSRSFQDSEMSYDDLIKTILLDYKIYSFTQCMDRPMSIGRPLFQYKETDYEFLKRVASHLGLQLICDIINPNNVFYFGNPTGRSYEIEDDIDYIASLDIKKYRESIGYSNDFHPTDFFYYMIKTRKVMEIGAKVTFKEKEFYVNSYEAEYIRGELIYTYRLCRENGIWQEKLYNDKIRGISLEGRVMEVSGEQVKLHLNIDEAQSQSKAAWFRYAPPTGNLMYSMPIVGTNANLYFPSERSQDPMVIGCVRKNGSSCENFSNVNNRYFATESGNNLDMLPGAINFSRPGLSANFNDGSGITLSSSSNLSISAGYVGIFAGDISIEGETKLTAKKGDASTISLESDFYNSASIIMEKGSDRASNPKFTDDEPTNGASEAKAALEAATQFNTHALAAANRGAEGKIGDFSNLVNSEESKSNSSESGEKSALESVMDFLFPPTTCYAAERENSLDSNKGNLNTELNIDLRDTLNKPWANAGMDGTKIKSGYDVYREKTYNYCKTSKPYATDAQIYGYIAHNAPWEYKLEALKDYICNYSVLSYPKQFGLYQKQIFVNSCVDDGIDPGVYGDMVEDFSQGMLFEAGFTIAGRGIKAASALKSGEALSEGEIIAGSGAGNLFGGKKSHLSKRAYEHIFHGNINGKGLPSGYHKPSMMSDAIISNISNPNKFGVYKATIEINGKTKMSTFFPNKFNRVDVVNSIEQAYASIKINHGEGWYIGKDNLGMEIRMWITNNKEISTAFPLY